MIELLRAKPMGLKSREIKNRININITRDIASVLNKMMSVEHIAINSLNNYIPTEAGLNHYHVTNDDLIRAKKNLGSDMVNNPPHYKLAHLEPIDAMESIFNEDELAGFCIGNALKYIWRWRNKGGLEDLKKAQWYLNRFVNKVEKINQKGK